MGRRTRFIVTAHALTAVTHLVPALALVNWLGIAPGVSLGIALWLAVAWRLHRLGHDRAKPRWVTRLIDEPVYAHWAACVMSVFFWPILALVLGALAGTPATQALLGAAGPAYVGGALIAAWGTYVNRRWVRVHRVELSFADLPSAFDGFRITQLSDLHIGSFDRLERGLAWAELANSLQGDLTVVTGDLVTAGTVFYPHAARVIAALQAPRGVIVSMGNHDQWDNDEFTSQLEQLGVQVLKNAWLPIERDGARVIVAGVDDASTGKADLTATLAGRTGAAQDAGDRRRPFTVLLAHYPSFFSKAAQEGVHLTLSGHTHGGQLGVPCFGDRWNVATWLGQRPRGTFAEADAFLHVNAGLGTTGPSLRIGIRPEISLITLRRAADAC